MKEDVTSLLPVQVRLSVTVFSGGVSRTVDEVDLCRFTVASLGLFSSFQTTHGGAELEYTIRCIITDDPQTERVLTIYSKFKWIDARVHIWRTPMPQYKLFGMGAIPYDLLPGKDLAFHMQMFVHRVHIMLLEWVSNVVERPGEEVRP